MTITTDQINRAPAGYYRAEGMIKNVNTIEEYRNTDKSQMIIQSGRTVGIILFGETDMSFRVYFGQLIIYYYRFGTLLMMAQSIHVLLCFPPLSFYHLQT